MCEPALEFQDWGLIDYEQALLKQVELVETTANTGSSGVIIFCTHPPVVTRGRKTQTGDVFSWDGKQIEVSRGGRATYHGPSQLVVYPILNLDLHSSTRPHRDVIWVLRSLEQAIAKTLATYRLVAHGKETTSLEDTGVWVNDKKIASVGIAVKRWVSFHGAAINLDHDPAAFRGMNPCGYSASVMTDLESLIGQKVDREEFKLRLWETLKQLQGS